MRHTFTRAISIALLTLAVLASPALSAVSPEVEKGLTLKYPGAGAATWDLGSDGYWEATFEQNEVIHRADFTVKGEWVKTEYSINFDELPEKVQEAVDRDLAGANITEIEALDHAMHGQLYEIWIERQGKMWDTRFREDGTPFGEILKLRDPQKRFESMEVWEIGRNFAFNLLTIFLLAWAIYYRRHHNHEMLFLLLGFNLFLFPIFLVSNNLSAGLGFTIFALLALVRLRSDTFSKTEIAYLLGAVSLTFINAQLAPAAEVIGASVVLITAWVADHPRLWADAYNTVNIRYRLKKTEAMLDQEQLRARISEEFRIDVTTIKIETVLPNEVRLVVLYRDRPGEKKALLKDPSEHEVHPLPEG